MKAVLVFLLMIISLSVCMAKENAGISINTAFHSPISPYLGIVGGEIDLLKNKNEKISFGLGVNLDVTNDGFPGMMVHVKPKISCILKNHKNQSNPFYLNTGLGLSYTYLFIATKHQTEQLNGVGFHFDLIPSLKLGKIFSIGIGSWTSIVFHSKSRIINKNVSFLSRSGIKLGLDLFKSKVSDK